MKHKMINKRRNRAVSRAAGSMERLESRTLMTATPPAVLANGVLTVTGTAAADAISVTFSTDQSSAVVTGTFTTVVNGTTQTFNTPGTTSVVVNSGQGNDTITINGTETFEPPSGTMLIPVNVSVTAGDGSSTIAVSVKDSGAMGGGTTGNPSIGITVGNGNNSVTTLGAANVEIDAGDGNDTFQSSQYMDPLTTSIFAGNGNDVFVAGSTETGNQSMTVYAGAGTDTFKNTDVHDSLQVNLGDAGDPVSESFSVGYTGAAITGTAFVDENGTGVYASNDPVLPDTKVYLDDNNDGTPGAGETSVVTDAAGHYLITTLDPSRGGTADGYTTHIRVVPTTGDTASDGAVTVNFGLGSSNINPYLIPVSTRLTGTLVATGGSFQNGGNTAAKAVDQNLSTYFDGATANGNVVGLALASPAVVTSIQYAPRSGWASRMVGAFFQGSNDAGFSTTTTLYTITTTPVVGVYTTVPVANSTAFKYVRYVSPAGSYGNLAEVQFYGIAPPPVTVNNGVLTVTGTTGADNISVVTSLFQENGPGPAAPLVDYGTYTVKYNGTTLTYGAGGVSGLRINSLDGNDTVSINGNESLDASSAAPINVSILAGNGNDNLTTSVTSGGSNTQPIISVVAGNGNDTVSLGGTDVLATLGNGNDVIDTEDTGQELGGTIVLGNGNDSYISGNAFQQVTVTAGTGANLFTNTDPDNTVAVAITGGRSFNVSYGSAVVSGKAYIDSNGDGLFEAGEPALANSTVNFSTVFIGPPQTLTAAVTTDASGNYVYAVPNPNDSTNATVTATVVSPAGYTAVPVSTSFAFFTSTVSAGYGRSGLNPSVVKQPALTGTLIATAGSYQNNGNTAAKAIDGNLNTYFDAPTANGNYVGLDLGSANVITSIAYAPRTGWASRMVGGIFQGSNSADFSSAVTLFTVTTAPVVGSLTTVSVQNTTPFRYVRYLSPAGGYGNVTEVQFFGTSIQPAGYVNGVLTINGTTGADNISLQLSGDAGNPAGPGTNVYTTVVDGVTQSFNVSSVKSIVITSGDGNDTIDVTSSNYYTPATLNLTINAGSGNDSIDVTLENGDGGANQFATVVAGNGNDSIIFDKYPSSGVAESVTVGNGNDTVATGNFDVVTIAAGNGNDNFLIDDSNSATINAGTGRDTLVNGFADFDVVGTFGAGPQVPAAIGVFSAEGLAFIDNNGNGTFDAGDTALANMQVYVDVNNNGIFDSGEVAVTTNALGYYYIANLDPANTGAKTYSLRVNNPGSAVATVLSQLQTAGALQANVNLPVKPGSGSINVHLFNDANGNGTQDGSETGLAGFDTFLDLNNDGIYDGSDVRGIADAMGNIFFEGLPAGTYLLAQAVPGGYRVTTPTTGFPIKVVVTAGGTARVTVGEEFVGVGRLTGTAIGTAGSYHNNGNVIANAFDGNFTSIFDGPDATGDWVGLDLGTPTVATQVQFAPRSDLPSRLKGGMIQASNTADFSSGVVTLATITTTPATGVLTNLSLNNTTAYRYYRYIGPANSYRDIAELAFLG